MRKHDNALATKALEIVADQLKESEEAAIKKVLRAINSGELTPEMALQKWYEIYALRKVPAKLRLKAKAGARSSDTKPVDTLGQ